MSMRKSHEFEVPSVVGETDVRFADGIGDGSVARPIDVAQHKRLFAWSFYRGHVVFLRSAWSKWDRQPRRRLPPRLSEAAGDRQVCERMFVLRRLSGLHYSFALNTVGDVLCLGGREDSLDPRFVADLRLHGGSG